MIDVDGQVGPVVGVRAKADAAAVDGASLFLVPAPQVGEVGPVGPSMRVIGVRSLDDALRAVGGAGCRPT